MFVKDFVHLEKMKACEELKKLQKERLDELKLATSKPKTREEAIFGKKYAILVEISDELIMSKFNLLTLVIDFYLKNDDVKHVE
jgi:hypothetical protein